jgi:hypothetical protein
VGGVVAFFLRYHPLKTHTTLSKSKKYMLFSKKCGGFLPHLTPKHPLREKEEGKNIL